MPVERLNKAGSIEKKWEVHKSNTETAHFQMFLFEIFL